MAVTLRFKQMSLVFMFVYVFLILVFLGSMDWHYTARLSHLDHSLENGDHNYHVHTPYRPRKPARDNDTRSSDGCHFDPDSLRVPTFSRLEDGSFFLSAFYDTRVPESPEIKVLAVRPTQGSHRLLPPVYCLVNNAHNHSVQPVRAQHYHLSDSSKQEHQTYIISCPVRDVIYSNPCKVRLSLDKQLTKQTLTLPLLSLGSQLDQGWESSGIAVCVTPLHGALAQSRLVEFIEMTQMLGANHLYIYQYTGDSNTAYSNPNTDQVLAYYNHTTTVTVYPWSLPFSHKLIAQYGQTMAMHHCLYTNMYRYRYLLVSDTSSLLIPSKLSNWTSLMDSLDDGNHAAFCYNTVIFPPRVGEFTVSMSSTQRTGLVSGDTPHCVVRPERIIQIASRDTSKWSMETDYPVSIKPSVTLLHRYQKCDTMHYKVDCSELKEDTSALRYKTTLHQAYHRVMQALLDSEDR